VTSGVSDARAQEARVIEARDQQWPQFIMTGLAAEVSILGHADD
jgi:hypothetical protein